MTDIRQIKLNGSIFGFKDTVARSKIAEFETKLSQIPFAGNAVTASECSGLLHIEIPGPFTLEILDRWSYPCFSLLNNGSEAWPMWPNMCVGYAGFADYACYANDASVAYRACYADFASNADVAACAYDAVCACFAWFAYEATCACFAVDACNASGASEAWNASNASWASQAGEASNASYACYACNACAAERLSYNGGEYYPEEVELSGCRFLAFRIW